MWLNFFVLFVIAESFGAVVEPQDQHSFRHLLRSDTQDSISVYNVNLTTKGGIVKSGYENSVHVSMKMIIQPYLNQMIHVHVEQQNITATNQGTDYGQKSRTVAFKDLKSFEFLLTHDGKMILEKDEKDVNARKALASNLLFDWKTFPKDPKSTYSSVFNTFYGSCKGVESVHEDTNLVIEQNFIPMKCSGFRWFVLTDNDNVETIAEMQMTNYRKLDFTQNSGQHVLKKVQTQQHVFRVSGIEGDIEHFLHTFYDIQLDEEAKVAVGKPSEDLFDVTTLHDTVMIPVKNNDYSHLMSVPEDVRRDDMKQDLQEMLESLSNIHQTRQISDHILNPEKELINVVDYMKFFTEEDFAVIYEIAAKANNEGNAKILKAFLETLPLVGTPAATIFVVKLTVDPKVDFDREKMLSKLAGSIRHVSSESLDSLRSLAMNKDSTSSQILAYGAALSEISKQLSTPYAPPYYDDKSLIRGDKKRLQRGCDDLAQKLSDTMEYGEQVVLIHALEMFPLPQTTHMLLEHFRASSKKILVHIFYAQEKFFKNFQEDLFQYALFGLSNDLTTEDKCVMVKILLQSGPTEAQFIALARRMQKERDHELYNFFVTTATILIEQKKLPHSASAFLRRLEPEARSHSFFFEMKGDLKEKLALSGHVIFDNETKGFMQLQLDVLQYYSWHYIKRFSLLLRISDVALISRLNNIGTSMFNQNNFTYEIKISKGSRTIYSTVSEFDFESVTAALQPLFQLQLVTKELFDCLRSNIYSLSNVDYFFPIDTGKYVRVYDQTSLVLDFKFNIGISMENKPTVGLIFSTNATLQSVEGIEVLQPSVMALQGSKQSSDLHFTNQIALDIFHDPTKNDFRNIYIAKNNIISPLFGTKIEKESEIYLDRLKKSPSQNTTVLTSVRVPDFHKDSIFLPDQRILPKGTLEDLGVEYSIESSHCRSPLNIYKLPQSLPELMYSKPFSELMSLSPGDFIVSFVNYLQKTFLLSNVYGVYWRALIQSSETFDTAKIGLRLNWTEKHLDILDSEDNVRVKYLFDDDRGDIQIARIKSGRLTTALCLKYEKSNQQISEWSLKIAYGQYEEEIMKCPRDQTEIYIEGASKYSAEQLEYHKHKSFTYAQCRPVSDILASEEAENSFTCAKAATMFRDLVTRVHYKNVPPAAEYFFRSLGIWMFSNSKGFRIPPEEAKSSGNFDIGIYRPMHSNEEFEMAIYTPDNTFVTRGSSKWLLTENSAFHGFTEMFDSLFIHPICRIYPQDLPQNSSEWTTVATIDNSIIINAQRVGEDQLAINAIFIIFQYNEELEKSVGQVEQQVKIFPKEPVKDENGKYNVMVTEEDIDSMPISYPGSRLSAITIGDTIFLVNPLPWYNVKAAIGYNGKTIFVRGLALGRNGGMCFGNENHSQFFSFP